MYKPQLVILALITLFLSACTEVTPPPATSYAPSPAASGSSQAVVTQNLAEPNGQASNIQQDNACPSNKYAFLVGQKYQNIPQENLPPYFRTLKPNQNLIMSQPLRVNLYLDRLGKVTSVRCG